MPLMVMVMVTAGPAFDGLRRRLADMTPREQRLLKGLALAVVAFVVGVTVTLVESSVGERERRNEEYSGTLRLVREKGPAYRDRAARQADLEARLRRELPPLPSIIGEVLGQLGQARQDFQELAPETVGLPGQRRKPWTRLSVRFPLRKVPITTVFQFLIQLRERYGDLPIAVTSLDLRLDRSEANLFNAEMVVSAYRFTDARQAGDGGGADGGSADKQKAAAGGGATGAGGAPAGR